MPVTLTPISSSGSAAGYYTTQEAVQDYAGANNISIWSANDGQQTVDTNGNPISDVAAIQASLNITDSEINGVMRDGPFAVPLSGGGEMGLPFPIIVQQVATCICIYHLYAARGYFDKDPNDPSASKVKSLYKWAQSKLALWKGGVERLPCTRRWPAPTSPVGIG